MRKLSLLKLILSMVIFGTIGLFVKYIPITRGFLAMIRGAVGAAVLILFMLLTRRKPDIGNVKKNLLLLIFSGAAIGINWILLFESYSYTSVAVATLSYYMAPIFVIILAPFVTGERVTVRKGICVAVSIFGMVLVSGVSEGDGIDRGELVGVLLALGAALFYASVTLMNKRMRDISSYDMTIVQLLFASLVILPYTFIFEDNSDVSLDVGIVFLILAVGVIHTGIAYLLFFSSVKELNAQTVAIFSYLDPIVAVILSVVFLAEGFSVYLLIGAVLILLSALFSEMKIGKGT